MNWKPIESAPKDGTTILLYYPNEGSVITSGWWEETPREWDKDWGEWKIAKLPSHGCGCCSDDNSEPTHWMELPDLSCFR